MVQHLDLSLHFPEVTLVAKNGLYRKHHEQRCPRRCHPCHRRHHHRPHCCHCPLCRCLPAILPSPSLLHTTPIANAMALAAHAIIVAHHLHSPSPFPPLPSSLLPLKSAARSHCSSLPVIVVLWSSTLSCQPSPTFNVPVASYMLLVNPHHRRHRCHRCHFCCCCC